VRAARRDMYLTARLDALSGRSRHVGWRS
jgi:hypothetical protein